MKNKQILTMVGAMLAVGMLWAEGMSVTVHRMQQRYPWNGLVDIDYTVAGVPEGHEAEYYVRFKLKENGKTHILHEFLAAQTLVDASNGTYRVTWNSAAEIGDEYRFVAEAARLKAEVVGCNGDKSSAPYGEMYLIVDLSGGATAAAYPVEWRRITGQSEANAMFNTGEYKTDKLVLRRVRAGTFMMGSPEGEYGREANAGLDIWNLETRHQVKLTKDFYLGIFNVTQAQYLRVTGTNPTISHKGDNADPVAQVSYAMIRGNSRGCSLPADFGKVDESSFMGLLSAKTGIDFDLPTEAQWEYACRAGTTTATYAGDFSNRATAASILDVIASWNLGVSSSVHPAMVGNYQPNAWGFYDMLGGVWNICRDRVSGPRSDNFGYSAETKDIPLQVDPIGSVSGGGVTARGSSAYDTNEKVFRAAFRLYLAANSQDLSTSFRVCSFAQ